MKKSSWFTLLTLGKYQINVQYSEPANSSYQYYSSIKNTISIKQNNKIIFTSNRRMEGVFVKFNESGIHLYTDCWNRDEDQLSGSSFWSVRLFEDFIQQIMIETSLSYRLGNGAVRPFINAFCASFELWPYFENYNKIVSDYLPNENLIRKVELFKGFNL